MQSTYVAASSFNDKVSAESLKDLYKLSETDLKNVRAFSKQMAPKIKDYVDEFYVWLKTQPEYVQYFSDPQKLESVKNSQIAYWQEFFAANVDEQYVEKRRLVGEVHARIGLPLQVYFAAMSFSLWLASKELTKGKLGQNQKYETIMAITKLMHFDTAVVVDTFMRLTNKTISEQSQSLMEMSTPVSAIWDDILILPIVGIIDSKRAQDMMITMLTKISDTQSRVIILDISGVAVVDTAVANHLIKITKATKLMGCECLISGISPAIAQTVVELGIIVGEVQTTGTLKDALAISFRITGKEIKNA